MFGNSLIFCYIYNILACNPGHRWNGQQCVICPDDTYSDTENAESCHDCPVNHFTFQAGSTRCYECKTAANILSFKILILIRTV